MHQLFELSGVDLSGYGKQALQRRLHSLMSGEGVSSIAELGDRMRRDPRFLGRVLDKLMLRVTTMFRNPSFFRCFGERVVPLLHTYPYPRLWVAGCSTGQEAFSLAIALREAGLYDRCRIYATDSNEAVLEQARSGLLPLSSLDEYQQNYRAAGGVRELSDYYTRGKSWAAIDPAVVGRIAVFRHVILLDVQMPGMSGIETAALIRARERSRTTPIIFLTGMMRTAEMLFSGYSAGAVDYLMKPLEPEVPEIRTGFLLPPTAVTAATHDWPADPARATVVRPVRRHAGTLRRSPRAAVRALRAGRFLVFACHAS